jgi:hypothetical protein
MSTPASRLATLLLPFALAAGACAAGWASGRPSRNVITRAEVEAEGPSSVFDLVQKIRPYWLTQRTRSLTQDTEVVVYLDGTRMGGPEALRQVSTPDVEKLEYLDARLATARLGTGHVNGAILITTRS